MSTDPGHRLVRELSCTLALLVAVAGTQLAAANPRRHSAGAHGIGAIVTRDHDPRWSIGAASTLRGMSSRYQGPDERHLLVTRGDAFLELGGVSGEGESGAYVSVRGSLAVILQLYRVVPLALHLEDLAWRASRGNTYARGFVGTGASLPVDTLLSMDGDRVAIASAFVGGWRQAPTTRNLRWAQGARADYMDSHLGVSAWWLVTIDGGNRAHKKQLALFLRDVAGVPIRVGVDLSWASGVTGSRVSAFVAWGLAP